MPEAVRRTLNRYIVQLRKRLGSEIEGIILYGSLVRGEYVEGYSNVNLVIILRDCTLENVQQCARLSEKSKKQEIVPPLVLTEEELRNTVECFPLEYFEIKDNHVLLEGRDPFLTLHISDRNLQLQCQQELNGNLFRVRQRFIEGGGSPQGIRALLPLSLTALLPCLRGVCRIAGLPSGGTSRVFLQNVLTTLNLDDPVFLEILDVKQGIRSPGTKVWPHLYDRYVTALQQVIVRVQKSLQQS